MKSILAVDDDLWVLETLTDALTTKGYPSDGVRMLRLVPERTA